MLLLFQGHPIIHRIFYMIDIEMLRQSNWHILILFLVTNKYFRFFQSIVNYFLFRSYVHILLDFFYVIRVILKWDDREEIWIIICICFTRRSDLWKLRGLTAFLIRWLCWWELWKNVSIGKWKSYLLFIIILRITAMIRHWGLNWETRSSHLILFQFDHLAISRSIRLFIYFCLFGFLITPVQSHIRLIVILFKIRILAFSYSTQV